jgi:hypothetical protein
MDKISQPMIQFGVMHRPVVWIFIILAFSMTAITGCQESVFTAPLASSIELPAPVYITPEALAADFFTDPEKANTEYKDKRFYFGMVQTDTVSKTSHPMRLYEDFVMVGNIKYKPRYANDMDYIVEGTILEITGIVRGLQFGYVLVNDCWFHVISGGGVTPGSY